MSSYRKALEPSGDVARDIAAEIARRVGKLRLWFLVPGVLLSLATISPALRLLDFSLGSPLRTMLSSGSYVVQDTIRLIMAFQVVPLGLFGLTWVVYRLIRKNRVRAWTAELSRAYGVPTEDVDALAKFFG